MINCVALSGNLTRDAELRATAGGTQVMSFGVAVNDRRRNPQTGEWEDYPNFVDCTMFGTRAEALSRFLSKGMKVAIEGKLRYSSWERDGVKRSKLEVIVDEIEFLSRHEADSAPQQAPPVGYTQADVQASYLPPRDPQTGGYGPTPAPFYHQIGQSQPTLMPQGDYYQPAQQPAPPHPQPTVYDEDIQF